VPPITPDALRIQLASGQVSPIYVVLGDDDEGKAEVLEALTGLVDEGLRPFNVDHFDGIGATNADGREQLTAALLGAARTLPMMAERRVVVVRRADNLLFPKGQKDKDEKGTEAEPSAGKRRKAAPAGDPLEAFVAAPEPAAVVVFVVSSLPRNRRLGVQLSDQTVVVCASDIQPDAAQRWVTSQVATGGPPLDAEAIRALVQRSVGDIRRLRAGLERVRLYGLGQVRVTAQDVREAVPAVPEAEENFGVSNAIAEGDAATALKQLGLALDAGAVPVMVMGQVRSAAERLPSARLSAALEAVLRTDLALKGYGSATPRLLLERLVVELCGMSGPTRRGAAGGRGWTPGSRPRR